MENVRREERTRGLVLVELALVLPLLLLLTLGIIEYGWMFLKAHQVTHAARQGARIGVTPDATSAQVQAAIADLMQNSGMGSSGYSVTFAPGAAETLLPLETFTVTVSVPYDNIALIGASLTPVPQNLTALVSMAKEGP